MDLNSWWNSGTTSFKPGLNHDKNGYNRIVSSLDLMVARSKISRLRLLWRRLKRDKKKYFACTSNLDHVPSYNPHTYSQNFDNGSMWADPDNHSRSFSARFAVPATIFQTSQLVG
ncbi:hypothetical protein FH972_002072 [Carpinus fangiana]|uniref:Uncharacterized protein n=1 Tax=Carpinus fangiana TaxID=176857 RepID=A0A5N6QGD2_9ROSI|nr:hypothetical protein FH972_002072 [Carpinus fangiana]